MSYEFRSFTELPRVALDGLDPKVAKHDYVSKGLHNTESLALIEAEKATIAFNGEKSLFYFKLGDSTLKIVREDYASVTAALKHNRVDGAGAAAGAPYLRPHYVAGVIAVCRTSDGQIIIGSRDASRSKSDPSEYQLQFPCGFIDTNDAFYEAVSKGGSGFLNEYLKENAQREAREEVGEAIEGKFSSYRVLGCIYETKKWRRSPKEDGSAKEGPETKDVCVIKSFVVEVNLNATFAEIVAARAAEVEFVNTKLEEADLPAEERENLQQRKKDLGEMTRMGAIPERDAAGLVTGSTTYDKVRVEFDDKPRPFVAEHGVTLSLVAKSLAPDPSAATYCAGRPLSHVKTMSHS